MFYDFISGGLASATTIEIKGAKGTDVVFLGATGTLSNIETAIDILTDNTGVEVTKTNAVAGSILVTSAGSNSDLTFTDIRSTNGDQAESITQVLKIEILTSTASNGVEAITSSSSSSELKITVVLGSDGSNVLDTTATALRGLLAGSANSSDFISATIEGTGAGVLDLEGLTAVTSGGVDAFLTFRSSDFGSDQFVDINVLSGTFLTNQLSVGGTAIGRDSGTNIVATINGQVAQGKGLKASLTTSILDTFVTFNTANNTANANAKITITGGGSLFQIGQEVSAAGQLGVGIEGMNTARLGGVTGKLYELGSGGGKSLIDVSPSVPGSTLVDILKEAIDDVTSLRGRLGAIPAAW